MAFCYILKQVVIDELLEGNKLMAYYNFGDVSILKQIDSLRNKNYRALLQIVTNLNDFDVFAKIPIPNSLHFIILLAMLIILKNIYIC